MAARRFKELRNKLLIGATAFAVRLLLRTLRIRVEGWERIRDDALRNRGVIFGIWHNTLMLSLRHESCRGVTALVSPGRDGEFATRVIARFGVSTIRGSSSRDSVRALLAIVHRARPGMAFAFTPDGPRGPLYHFQPGAVYSASRSGLPFVPLGIAVSRSWRLRSWDRFRIPKPFARLHLVFGSPEEVPPALSPEGIEAERSKLDLALRRVSELASKKAGTLWPDPMDSFKS